MTARCAVRDCQRPAQWVLQAEHNVRGRRTVHACGRHVDGLATRISSDIGTPTQTPYRAPRTTPPPEQLDLLAGA